jgi:hypothetical protein
MEEGEMKKAVKGGRVIPMHPERVVEMRGAVVGRVVGRLPEGFSVDFPGNPHGPTVSRSTVSLRAVARACEAGRTPEVMLVFEAERSDRPVIVGLIASEDEAKAELEEEGLIAGPSLNGTTITTSSGRAGPALPRGGQSCGPA